MHGPIGPSWTAGGLEAALGSLKATDFRWPEIHSWLSLYIFFAMMSSFSHYQLCNGNFCFSFSTLLGKWEGGGGVWGPSVAPRSQ